MIVNDNDYQVIVYVINIFTSVELAVITNNHGLTVYNKYVKG